MRAQVSPQYRVRQAIHGPHGLQAHVLERNHAANPAYHPDLYVQLQQDLMASGYSRNEAGLRVSTLCRSRPNYKMTSELEVIGHIRTDLQKLPQRTEGLNIARVEAFVRGLGLPIKEYRVILPEDELAFRQACGFNLGDELPGLLGDFWGAYMTDLDWCVLRRNPNHDALFGPEVSESTLVHELAHAANVSQALYEIRKKKDGLEAKQLVRSGFMLQSDVFNFSLGNILEEGFAELLRMKYLQSVRYPSAELRERIEESSNLALLDWDDTYLYWPLDDSSLHLRNQQKIGISRYENALKIMQRLCFLDPKIWPALLESRRGLQGLREVISRINALQPGLYLKLRNVEWMSPETVQSMWIAVSKIGSSF